MNYLIFFLENKTYSSVRTEALSVLELLLKKLEGEFLIFLIGGPESQETLWHMFLEFFRFSVVVFNKHILQNVN